MYTITCTPSPSVSWNRHGVKTLINIRNDACCWFVMKLDRFIGSVSTKYTCVHLLFQWMIYGRACDRSGWICIISPIYYRFWNWQKFSCTNSGSLLNKLENWMYGHQVVQFYSVVSRWKLQVVLQVFTIDFCLVIHAPHGVK
jgi:hypothetical protein